MAAPIVYNGIRFPFQKGGTSFPDGATNDDLIRDSLLQLVMTMNGERIMRPTFGTNAMTFVFENNNEALSNLLRAEVQGAIAKFEPRIQMSDLVVEQRGDEVILTIVYIVLATRKAGAATIAIPLP